MSGNYSRLKTRNTGAVISGPDDDAEFDNIIANSTPAGLDDASENLAAMQTAVDPYPGGSESLATSTEGEIHRVRFRFKQENGTTQWYIFPDLVSKTATYLATLDDRVILMDASGGDFSVTLPTAVGNIDKIYYLKNIGASGTATVDGNLSETIDGVTTKALGSQYDFIVIVSDGANWQTVGGVAANVVTLTDTQTLTNKTLTDPVIVGRTIQIQVTQSTASTSGSTALPVDGTFPQNTEGTEMLTVTITPKHASNILHITGAIAINSGGSADVGFALFQDSTANAIWATAHHMAANGPQTVPINFKMAAGTTSATTFKLRVGNTSGSTMTMNNVGFGGAQASTLRVIEEEG